VHFVFLRLEVFVRPEYVYLRDRLLVANVVKLKMMSGHDLPSFDHFVPVHAVEELVSAHLRGV
jgi:hypothetical protein